MSLDDLRGMGVAGRNDVARVQANVSGLPNKAGFSAEGLLAASELLGEWQFPGGRTFDDTNPSTTITVLVAPAADTDMPLSTNAGGPFVQVGHIHFAAGAYAGSVVFTSNPLHLSAGVRLRLNAPAMPDIAASDFYGLLVGTST